MYLSQQRDFNVACLHIQRFNLFHKNFFLLLSALALRYLYQCSTQQQKIAALLALVNYEIM
jgi:hypothetical protein